MNLPRSNRRASPNQQHELADIGGTLAGRLIQKNQVDDDRASASGRQGGRGIIVSARKARRTLGLDWGIQPSAHETSQAWVETKQGQRLGDRLGGPGSSEIAYLAYGEEEEGLG